MIVNTHFSCKNQLLYIRLCENFDTIFWKDYGDKNEGFTRDLIKRETALDADNISVSLNYLWTNLSDAYIKPFYVTSFGLINAIATKPSKNDFWVKRSLLRPNIRSERSFPRSGSWLKKQRFVFCIIKIQLVLSGCLWRPSAFKLLSKCIYQKELQTICHGENSFLQHWNVQLSWWYLHHFA